MGYHKVKIVKGELGQLSKIREEFDELTDAHYQGVRILMLCEVADLVGAIDLYLQKHLTGFSINDCLAMSKLTAEHKEEMKTK